MIRVLLADDQALVRGGFRALLDAEPDLTVVGEASTGDDAVAAGPSSPARRGADGHPDAGHRRPGRDPADRRRPAAARVRVVVVTTFELDEYVAEAHPRGASGFLVKDTEPADLLRAVRVVAAGDALLSPTVTRRLLATVARGDAGGRRAAGARRPHTARARGAGARRRGPVQRRDRRRACSSARSPSRPTCCAPATKLGARDRAQLVVVAYESGAGAPRLGRLTPRGATRDAPRGRRRGRPLGRRWWCRSNVGRLEYPKDVMLTTLVSHPVGYGWGWGPGPWFLLVPLFWFGLIALFFALGSRRRRRYWGGWDGQRDGGRRPDGARGALRPRGDRRDRVPRAPRGAAGLDGPQGLIRRSGPRARPAGRASGAGARGRRAPRRAP